MTTDRKLRTRAVENVSGARGRSVVSINSVVIGNKFRIIAVE
jgi:hypothetical protein